MFHVELRHFPANFVRFNLSEVQLRTMILERWTREEWVEIGERKWNPQEAKITVLEGPEMSLDQMTMGRGWRNAQRHGRDVTEEILARTRQAQVAKPDSSTADLKLESDSLALELLAELGDRRLPLRRAWELAAWRIEERIPSRSLALAEGAVYSLLRRGLIVILTGAAGEDHEPTAAIDGECDAILEKHESWASAPGQETIWISRC
jgi:hypothetical protein